MKHRKSNNKINAINAVANMPKYVTSTMHEHIKQAPLVHPSYDINIALVSSILLLFVFIVVVIAIVR